MTDSYVLDLSSKPLDLLDKTYDALTDLIFSDQGRGFEDAVQSELKKLAIFYMMVRSSRLEKTEVQPKPVKSSDGQKDCFYWRKNGRCNNGEKCRFRHDMKFKMEVTSHSAVVPDRNKMASCYMAMTTDEHSKCLEFKAMNEKFNFNAVGIPDSGSTHSLVPANMLPKAILKKLPKSEQYINSFSPNEVKAVAQFEADVKLGNILLKSCRFLVLPTDSPVVIGQNILRHQTIIKYGEDHVNSQFTIHGKNNTGNELQCKIPLLKGPCSIDFKPLASKFKKPRSPCDLKIGDKIALKRPRARTIRTWNKESIIKVKNGKVIQITHGKKWQGSRKKCIRQKEGQPRFGCKNVPTGLYYSPSAPFLDSSAGRGVSPTHYAPAKKKAADSKKRNAVFQYRSREHSSKMKSYAKPMLPICCMQNACPSLFQQYKARAATGHYIHYCTDNSHYY